MEQRIAHRLKWLYAGAFLQAFVLWYAIVTPFLAADLKLNKVRIALIYIVSSVIMMLLNVPLGVLADRWSRKNILLIASLSLALGSVIGGISHSFMMYVVSEIFSGIFFASTLGLYDSVVYDTILEESGRDEGYEHYYGRLNFITGLAFGTSSLLGGIVGHYLGMRDAYLFSAPVAVCSGLVLIVFREPLLHKNVPKLELHAHLSQTLRAVVRRGYVLRVVLGLVIVAVGVSIMSQLDQFWMVALALPIIWYGPVNAGLLIAGSSAGLLANRLKQHRFGLVILAIIALAAALALLVHNVYVVVAAEIALLGSLTTLDIILNKQLHDAVRSNIRSGASSMVSATGFLLFIPAAYMFGRVSDSAGVYSAAWIVVIVAALTLLSVLSIVAHRRKTVG